jgi:hypothetical protein
VDSVHFKDAVVKGDQAGALVLQLSTGKIQEFELGDEELPVLVFGMARKLAWDAIRAVREVRGEAARPAPEPSSPPN